MTLVADASVVLKWILPESGRDRALSLLDRFEAQQIDLIAPRIQEHEVASVLARRVRQRLLSRSEAQQAWDVFEIRHPMLLDPPELARAAFELSVRHHLSYWDCLYLALALAYRCELVTADQRFYRGAVKVYPRVRPL